MVKARNSVTRSSSPLRPEVVALVADESRWWVGPGEFAVLHVDLHEAAGWSLRRRARRRQHPVAVEVVDLLQLGGHPAARGLGTGGREGLDEQAARLPTEGGEDVGLAAGVHLLQPLVEELHLGEVVLAGVHGQLLVE